MGFLLRHSVKKHKSINIGLHNLPLERDFMENATENVPRAALVLAGGLGTRLRPITNRIPKPLVKVGSKPTIAHIIDEIARNGIKDIYVSVGYKSDRIISYLSRYKTPARIRFIKEEEQLGTGGAVKLALKTMGYRNADIFMTYGDDIFMIDIKKMHALHKTSGSDITLAARAARKRSDIESSAVVRLKGDRVIRFVEKPKLEEAPSRLINIGKYIINSSIYSKLPRKRKFSFEKEFMEERINDMNVNAFVSRGLWYPTDTPERLARAREGIKIKTRASKGQGQP